MENSMLLYLFSFVLAAQPVPGPAGEPEDPVRGPAPLIRIAVVDPDGKLCLEIPVMVPVSVPRTVEVEVGGKKETKTVTETVMKMEKRAFALDSGEIQVYSVDGKKIDPSDLPKLLSKRSPVLVSADGKKVDQFYLKLAREGTVVVVSRRLMHMPFLGTAPGGIAPPAGKVGEKLPPVKDRDK